jgi:curved DNA-binding protein CbpA
MVSKAKGLFLTIPTPNNLVVAVRASLLKMICFQIPQAYKDLERTFFLCLDSEAEASLKKHFIEQTRRYHPDLLGLDASNEKREELEARVAALNAAYLKLRDQDSRLDLVLEHIENEVPELKLDLKPQIPNELASDYFELQDALLETPDQASTRDAYHDFLTKVEKQIAECAEQIKIFCRETPIECNKTQCQIPKESYLKLSRIRSQERYLKRLHSDLKNKKPLAWN